MDASANPAWLTFGFSALKYILSGMVGAGIMFVAFVRRQDKTDAEIEVVKEALAGHLKDCEERGKKLEKVVDAMSSSQTELQGRIYSVQVAQAQQVTIEHMAQLTAGIVAAIDRRREND